MEEDPVHCEHVAKTFIRNEMGDVQPDFGWYIDGHDSVIVLVD